MLERFEKLRTSTFSRPALANTCGLALAVVCLSSISPADAAYEYTQDTSMPEAGIRIASMDVTARGETSTPKLGDDLDVFQVTVKDGKARLSAMIAAGESTGALTVEQTDRLRYSLDSLNGLDRKLNAKQPPSYKHLLELAAHYDATQAKVTDLATEYALQMVPTDPAAVMVGERTVSLDAAMKKRAELEDKISSDLACGQLSGGDGARLRTMLNTLALREGTLRKNSSFKLNEQTQVNTELSKVSAALKSAIVL